MKAKNSMIAAGILLFFLAACLESTKGPKAESGPEADKGGEVAVGSSPVSETQLTRLQLESMQDGQNNFDLKLASEIAWLSENELVFTSDRGRSATLNLSSKVWSSPRTSSETGDFPVLYDFRDQGIVGISDDRMSFRASIPGLKELKRNEDFSALATLGANPGFLAYGDAGRFVAYKLAAGGAKLYAPSDFPVGIQQAYPCPQNSDCVLWVYDGSSVQVLDADLAWTKLELDLGLPTDQKLKRLALSFENAKEGKIKSAVLLTDSGQVFYAHQNEAEEGGKIVWDDIKPIVSNYCLPCHKAGDDGFDREETWKARRDEMIQRLSADPNNSLAMPKAGSQAARDFTKADRDLMIAWLNEQVQMPGSGSGEIGAGDDEEDKVLSGNLKNLAEENCLSCHPDAKVESWWVDRKGNVENRIRTGSMPKGKKLSDEKKSEFYEVLKSL